MLYQLSYSRPAFLLFASPGRVKGGIRDTGFVLAAIRETGVANHSMTRVYGCVALASLLPGLDTSTA